MAIELRLPNIKGNDREQLVQIRSYLYQLTEQLQWAFNNLDTSASRNYVAQQPRALVAGSSKVDAQATFDSIKALIIKSADIVNAYYEEINTRLEGAYVAESDFGTYMEQTSQDISQNSTEIESIYSNIQTILSDIDNIEYALIEANAYIRSGLLYYDENETPIYGLEIGQKNIIDGEEVFNKYARFTADRLSFYDQNDTEIAYVSDYKLFIRNVEITSSYKIGGLVDTVMANGDVVTKWVGGDG